MYIYQIRLLIKRIFDDTKNIHNNKHNYASTTLLSLSHINVNICYNKVLILWCLKSRKVIKLFCE